MKYDVWRELYLYSQKRNNKKNLVGFLDNYFELDETKQRPEKKVHMSVIRSHRIFFCDLKICLNGGDTLL